MAWAGTARRKLFCVACRVLDAPSALRPAASSAVAVFQLRRLLREPLGYRSGLKFALLVVKAQTDHPITVLNLLGINVIDLAAVLLAGESGRAVVVNDLLVKAGGAPSAHGQGGFLLVATRDDALPAARRLGQS